MMLSFIFPLKIRSQVPAFVMKFRGPGWPPGSINELPTACGMTVQMAKEIIRRFLSQMIKLRPQHSKSFLREAGAINICKEYKPVGLALRIWTNLFILWPRELNSGFLTWA